MSAKRLDSACLLFLCGTCILFFGCTAPPPPTAKRREVPPPLAVTNPAPESPPIGHNPAPPPKPSEVRNAVSRIFHGVMTVDSERKPSFLVGDFNGDVSQDLAVIVKPVAGNLSLINDELAAWILVDPLRTATRQRVRIADNYALLAVVHGFGSSGWRHSQATQAYVLRGVADGAMKLRARRQILQTAGKDKLPRVWGDVIEQTINGQSGFLYYNGAKYGWYDPLTYKPSPPARIVHGEVSR